MKIGVITFKKFDENVLINEHFSVEELFKIMTEDQDFVRFDIFDENKRLIRSTDYRNLPDGKGYISFAVVKKEVEILSTDYNAYRTPTLIHRVKTRWNVLNSRFRIKKKAIEYADKYNSRQMFSIELLKNNH